MTNALQDEIINFYANYQMTILPNDIKIVLNDKELMLTINFKNKKIKYEVLEELQKSILSKHIKPDSIKLIRFKIKNFITKEIINFNYNLNEKIIIKFLDGIIDTLKFYNTSTIECKSTTFTNCSIDEILINQCELETIKFDIGSKFISKVKIIDTTFDTTNLLSRFKITTNTINDLIIKNSYIAFAFDIYSQDTKSDIRANVNLNYILIADSKFERTINLSKLNIKDKIYIINTEFMSNISFNKTTTNQCTFNAVIFDTLSTSNFNEFKITNNTETDRNTLRVIKSHLESQHNKIEANIYHSYELKARENELKKVNYLNNFNDKVIFKFNNIVSKHGLKWYIPLFWIFIIGLYYSAYLMSVLPTDNIKNNIFLTCLSISSLFFVLYNSFFKEDSSQKYILSLIPAYIYYYQINGLDLEALIRFISIVDFTVNNCISFEERSMSKLIMGVLIYHLIIAFRKDTRQ